MESSVRTDASSSLNDTPSVVGESRLRQGIACIPKDGLQYYAIANFGTGLESPEVAPDPRKPEVLALTPCLFGTCR